MATGMGRKATKKKQAEKDDRKYLCPYCNKEIGINTKGYFCDCGLKIFKTIAGRTLSDNDVSILLEKNILPKYNKYKSKNGNLFSAYLVLVEENGEKITKFKFEND
jgi:DNA topoisomerase-3